MTSATPSSLSLSLSLSRVRPAVLVLAGIAAALAGYHVYSASRAAANTGLHRSNALRRTRARQRRHASQAARLLALLEGDPPIDLGTYDYHGVHIPLSLHALAPPAELAHTIRQAEPGIAAHNVDTAVGNVYAAFLNRLLAFVSPDRPLSPAETDILATWVHHLLPDSAALARAVERHAATLPTAHTPPLEPAESVAPTDMSLGSPGPDHQTLQRTLYHIAEDRARQEGVVHRGITCNGCDEKPIRGIRWHCANCADFDLCANCEATNSHTKTHIFYKIRVPAPYLSMPKQEPLYPGKPHAMPSSVDSALKRRLVNETKMEAEEIEALWHQFTCLAGTEWPADPNHIGWALDRRAFNHTFIPRYNSFVAAPNLIYDRIFVYYDTDKNGLIGFEEWIKGLDGMHASSGTAKSRMIFNGYDVDGDGYISRKDVLRIFRAYYAIEKEATRNYVAEITEELSVRNAMDTIRSSQPLGSAFPPHDLGSYHGENLRLQEKIRHGVINTPSVVQENDVDVATRQDMLRMTDTRNLPQGTLSEQEQNQIVSRRWERREFYVDEEEGLTRVGPAEQQSNTESSENPHEPGLNAGIITSGRGASWRGYEIPVPERDLGREVMYQITQQAFNELLDPLFLGRENDSMDVAATRRELRKQAVKMGEVEGRFMRNDYAHVRVICKIGLFRYAKCIVDMFCRELNKEPIEGGFKKVFDDDNGRQIGAKDARVRLSQLFSAVNKTFCDTVSIPEEYKVDDLTSRNMWLCRSQFEEELVNATVACAHHVGWLSSEAEVQPLFEQTRYTSAPQTYRDPTMPQFRPNSLADNDSWTSISDTSSTSDESESTDTSSFSEDGATFHVHIEGEDQVFMHRKGPFFVLAVSDVAHKEVSVETDLVMGGVVTDHATAPSPSSSSAVVAEAVVTDIGSGALQPQHDGVHENLASDLRTRTNHPVLQLLHTTTTDGITKLQSTAKPVNHSMRPFHPETDQYKLVLRHIRDLAMDPDSKLHVILLVTLLIVLQNDNHRGGGGLINLQEFEEYLGQGKSRFLEAWMEWVSI